VGYNSVADSMGLSSFI